MRPETDPNFIPNILMVSDQTEALVEQIKMTLLTDRGEVLGDPNFGFSAYDYLFSTNSVDISAIESKAGEQISSYATLSNKVQVTTQANVYEIEKYRNAIGLDINVGDLGKFGILFD